MKLLDLDQAPEDTLCKENVMKTEIASKTTRRKTRAQITQSHCSECGQIFSHTSDHTSGVCAACRSLESFEQARRRHGSELLLF